MRMRERRLRAACEAFDLELHEVIDARSAWGADPEGDLHRVTVDPRDNTARHSCADAVCRGADRSLTLVL
ncbi:hypothetical protein SEA_LITTLEMUNCHKIN_61 [Gordonia phage LittleMunchkin]|nr:hypothetical protein SEA_LITTLEMUNCHKIN_61 [Gordonia phage LittleMunchkin]